MEDRNVKSVDFEQGDLVQQLREKIRTQAQRLRNLEQYRLLCEQRINELYPGHNFPVKPEDLGTHQSPSSTQELLMAKQKIARLEQQLSQTNIKVPLTDNYTFPNPSTQLTLAQLQELYSAIYYQHYNIIKEKNLIEESLRAEMLNCEEQRAYIEVLKQALESNLQELGLTGRTIEDILNRKDRNNEEDSEVQTLNELLKAKTEEFNSLVEERSKSDKHLQEAAEALQYAEEEVQRLEEEKSALLDYIEDHSAKEKQMVFELEKLRKDFGEHERKYQSLGKDYNNELNSKREIEKELQDLRSDTSRQEKAYKDSYEDEIIKLKGHIKTIESRNESLQANNTTLSNTLKETQEELDTIKSQHDSTIKETSAVRRTLSISESKIEEIERTSQQLTDSKKDLEIKLSKTEKELKNFKQNLAKELELQYEKISLQMNDEVSELKTQLDLCEAKEKALNKENSELKKKIKKIQDELSKNSSLSSQEVLELKKNLDNAQVSIQQNVFEKDKLLSDLQKVEFSLNSEKTNNSLLEDENNNLREKLEENSKTVKQLMSDNREKENRLQSLAFEIENLKKNLNISLKDIENERVLKTQYYEEVLKFKKIQNSLSSASFQIEESKKIISLFSSNFGAVSSASNSYYSIISNSFRDLLFKCNESENIVISE